MSQYFVRRGEKTLGPMSESKVSQMIKARRLKPNDEVSVHRDGPWSLLSESRQAIMDGTYEATEVFETDASGGDEFGVSYSDDDYGMPGPRKKKQSKKKEGGDSKREVRQSKPRSKARIALFCVLGWLLIAGGYSLYEQGAFKSQQQLSYERALQQSEDAKGAYERGLKDSEPDSYRQYQEDQIRDAEFEATGR